MDKDLLGWWLCERQVKQGGLNGRPEKLPDVSLGHELSLPFAPTDSFGLIQGVCPSIS